MKYVVTGSLGHISKPIVRSLIEAGHEVVVITRNKDRIKDIESLGAKAAVGSIEDVPFLIKAFKGANAVYTMVPPVMEVNNWKDYIGKIGNNYAKAIQANNIKYVVNLSSVGAHKSDGCGPVSGLYRAEQALNNLPGVNIQHLRPSYFYSNLYGNIDLIKNMGIIGSNFDFTDKKFPIVEPTDIAEIATEELLNLEFSGHRVRYIASDEVSTDEIASSIGKAIGKPDLKWVSFTDDQAMGGMLQAGLPEEIAKNYTEMGRAIQSGELMEDYWKNHPRTLEKTKLSDFANEFAKAYNAN